LQSDLVAIAKLAVKFETSGLEHVITGASPSHIYLKLAGALPEELEAVVTDRGVAGIIDVVDFRHPKVTRIPLESRTLVAIVKTNGASSPYQKLSDVPSE
jgi:hypothetical protein